jgi:hypothetical protein
MLGNIFIGLRSSGVGQIAKADCCPLKEDGEILSVILDRPGYHLPPIFEMLCQGLLHWSVSFS